MSLIAKLKGKGPSGFGYGSTAEEVTEGLDLSNKTYLLTGCNAGLGLETLRVLSMRGAHILATGRTREKAMAAISSVSANATPLTCELAEPASVRECAREVAELGKPLDGIICNAGIMAVPKLERAHGFELQFFTNHIGHFILVTHLLDRLAPQGRVVMLSSSAHQMAPAKGIQFDNLSGEKGYSPWRAYGQSKLANLLFAKALARRLQETGKVANAVHPGVIATELGRYMNPLFVKAQKAVAPIFLKSIPEGAATQCYVATHPNVEGTSGEYFADCNIARPTKLGRDEALAERLWTVSEEIVAKLF